MKQIDLVILGGGPAGLAAAIAARKAGVQDLLILERDRELGGILNQCIHSGFGLHTFREELTGPEYAARFAEEAIRIGIPYKLNTMVLDLSADRVVTAVNRTDGLFQLQAKAVILAMGCRERPRGALNIPGTRPAGIYTAGTAQRLVNMEGYLPGRRVVILGSGDIGLIMARRMTLEGAKVLCVAELMPYSGGLKRNIVQCLDDFGIPLKLSHTVVDIEGKERVTGVTIARVENGKPVPGTEEHFTCDTLLLSCGLLPENELSRGAGVALSPVTNGPLVDERLQTNLPGVFAAGNVLHVHDLVDYVSEEAAAAGQHAAAYILGETTPAEDEALPVTAANGVRYTVDFENGQKTGFFLDQKYNRQAVARLARGRRVLDCFTHTGSFALNAAMGGAAHVTAVDVSETAVEMARANAVANGLDDRMDFVCCDVFDLLPRLEKEGSGYDFIILDPPAFTKARKTAPSAMRGYKEINYRAMKLLPRGGYLATASCSHFATEAMFRKMLHSAAADAGRQLRQIEVRQQAADHPVLWGVEETEYLKFFLFQVV